MKTASAFLAVVGLVLATGGRAQEPAPRPDPGAEPPTEAAIRAAMDRGVACLLRDQNRDGSWGGPRNKTFTDSFANPATHDAWTVATTGLVVMALVAGGQTPETQAAADRGVDFLTSHAEVKRPADWDIDNVWGFVYGLQGVAHALRAPRYRDSPRAEALRAAGAKYLGGLERYQSPNGGWAYYANKGAAWRPEWATSFTTAAGIHALLDAKDAGLPVADKLLRCSVRTVKHCRLPTGAYTYSVEAIPAARGLENIDDVKGSLGRIQVCNLALFRTGDTITAADLKRGVELFFEHHRFLDCALRKPIPHEAWYQNAAYFYLFGHYYAAQVIARLPAADRAAFWPRLQREVLKTQEPDGGLWDFYISAHTKPYGTAFGILALLRSLEPAPE